jgi:hypothetical protein
MKIPGVIHPTGQLLMAVNLIGYGSVRILHSVFYLSLNPGEAPGWHVIAIDAGYHLLAMDTQQQCLYPGILALVPLWGKCRDGNDDYVEVCVICAMY